MIALKIIGGDVAETWRKQRKRPAKSLKLLGGNIGGNVAETAETSKQVIENKAETETETYPPSYGGRARTRAPAHAYVRRAHA